MEFLQIPVPDGGKSKLPLLQGRGWHYHVPSSTTFYFRLNYVKIDPLEHGHGGSYPFTLLSSMTAVGPYRLESVARVPRRLRHRQVKFEDSVSMCRVLLLESR
jgi:hypothetical protein